jgi:hypothetical protein
MEAIDVLENKNSKDDQQQEEHRALLFARLGLARREENAAKNCNDAGDGDRYYRHLVDSRREKKKHGRSRACDLRDAEQQPQDRPPEFAIGVAM